MRLPQLRYFSRFFAVGACGFVIDAGILQGLISLKGMHALEARLFSFLIAVTFTWLLNRHFTFSITATGTSRGAEYLKYIAVQIVGATINYATFAALLILDPAWKRLAVLPLAIASVIAMSFNYIGMRHFVFKNALPSHKAEH